MIFPIFSVVLGRFPTARTCPLDKVLQTDGVSLAAGK